MMLPVLTTLPIWAASLIIDFPGDNIPILKDEQSWKIWGDSVVQELSFARNNAPGTDFFNAWQEWATALYSVMQDESV